MTLWAIANCMLKPLFTQRQHDEVKNSAYSVEQLAFRPVQ